MIIAKDWQNLFGRAARTNLTVLFEAQTGQSAGGLFGLQAVTAATPGTASYLGYAVSQTVTVFRLVHWPG